MKSWSWSGKSAQIGSQGVVLMAVDMLLGTVTSTLVVVTRRRSQKVIQTRSSDTIRFAAQDTTRSELLALDEILKARLPPDTTPFEVIDPSEMLQRLKKRLVLLSESRLILPLYSPLSAGPLARSARLLAEEGAKRQLTSKPCLPQTFVTWRQQFHLLARQMMSLADGQHPDFETSYHGLVWPQHHSCHQTEIEKWQKFRKTRCSCNLTALACHHVPLGPHPPHLRGRPPSHSTSPRQSQIQLLERVSICPVQV